MVESFLVGLVCKDRILNSLDSVLYVMWTYGINWTTTENAFRTQYLCMFPKKATSMVRGKSLDPAGILEYKWFFYVILYVIILFDIKIDIKIRFIFLVETMFYVIFYVTYRILYNSKLFFIYSCHLYYIFHIKKKIKQHWSPITNLYQEMTEFFNMKNIIEMTTIYEKQFAII
jgi:hypothetical protein